MRKTQGILDRYKHWGKKSTMEPSSWSCYSLPCGPGIPNTTSALQTQRSLSMTSKFTQKAAETLHCSRTHNRRKEQREKTHPHKHTPSGTECEGVEKTVSKKEHRTNGIICSVIMCIWYCAMWFQQLQSTIAICKHILYVTSNAFNIKVNE